MERAEEVLDRRLKTAEAAKDAARRAFAATGASAHQRYLRASTWPSPR
jgi:hypothetical protein